MTAIEKTPSQRTARYRFSLILIFYLAVTLPFCFLGHGSDNDSYQVIGAGKLVWEQHSLVTSRLPGYWVFETAVYFLNRLGGALLVNLVSLGMGAGILWRLDRLRTRLPQASITVASICLILVPAFQIAASSCDDYLWSLLPLMLSFEDLLDHRDWQAGLWGALVVAIRPTNAVVLVGLYVGIALARHTFFVSGEKRLKGVRSAAFFVAATSLSIGFLPLLLSYWSFGNSFAFLHEIRTDSSLFTWKMYVGRFGYKILTALGPLTFAVLVAGCFLLRRRFLKAKQYPELAVPCACVITTNLGLFARFPLEISYLLPAMVFGFILLSLTVLPMQRWMTTSVIAALAISNVCTIRLASPNVPDRASKAYLTLGVEAGPVIEDMRARKVLIGCESLDCWKSRTGH